MAVSKKKTVAKKVVRRKARKDSGKLKPIRIPQKMKELMAFSDFLEKMGYDMKKVSLSDAISMLSDVKKVIKK